MNKRARVRDVVEADLPDIMRLWNDGETMRFVGFPDGLGVDLAAMRRWWAWVTADPRRRAFAIETEDLGYCGEGFYSSVSDGPACVDIKLRPAARGRGLGRLGLATVLDELFARTPATAARVDPHRDNADALRLYERLGFVETPWSPDDPERSDTHVLMTLTRAAWNGAGSSLGSPGPSGVGDGGGDQTGGAQDEQRDAQVGQVGEGADGG